MKNKLQIGITGGIGSGKSLICKIFARLSVPIYDADTRAKWLTNNDPEIKEAVINEFGNESFNESGLNREFISGIVFKNKERLEVLNAIIHPAVGRDYSNWVAQQTSDYVIKEAALMFESGSYKALDKIITVSAPENIRLQRVLKRDSFRSADQVKSIIDKQLSEKER